MRPAPELQKDLDENRDTIRKMQMTLAAIDRREKVWFNITQYTKLGLVHGIDRTYINAAGQKEWKGTDWYLTAKGKQMLMAARTVYG